MTDPRLLELIDGESLAEMGEKQGSALCPGQTDRPVEDINCNLVPAFGSGKLDRLLVEHLGIKKKAIHVEDDSRRPSGQLHVMITRRSCFRTRPITPHLDRRLVLALAKISHIAEQTIRRPLDV